MLILEKLLQIFTQLNNSLKNRVTSQSEAMYRLKFAMYRLKFIDFRLSRRRPMDG
jgi:hypothetical protein